MPAIAGVAALDAVFVALVALLLAVALFPLFRPLLQGALSSVPVVGGFLAENVDLLLFRAYVSALTWIGQAISPFADLLRRVRIGSYIWTEYVTQSVELTWWRLQVMRTFTIPQAAAQVAGYALGLMLQVERLALDLAQQEASYALALFGRSVAYALGLFGQAISYTDAVAARVLAYTDAVAARDLAYVQAVSARDLAFVRQSVVTAERYSEALFGRGIAYTQAAVVDMELQLERVTVVTEGYARALERVAVDHADQVGAAVGAGAAAATAAVAARVGALEDSPCQRFCGPLGDLGGLLSGLEDAALLAVLTGLLAEAMRDPGAIERALEGALLPEARDIVGAFQLGIPSA